MSAVVGASNWSRRAYWHSVSASALRTNGVRAQAPAQAVIDLMLDVATDKRDEPSIADWLRHHTVQR